MMNTNAIVLARREWLFEEGIEQLVSSMDGVDAKGYKQLRGANAFHVVWKNISEFKKASPMTQVGVRLT